MAQIIKIDGKKYPCRPTMGAMLRYKKQTGKEVTDLQEGNVSELVVYLYCCVVSACAVDKVPFDYDLQDFADRIEPTDLNEWAMSVGDASKKKTVSKA